MALLEDAIRLWPGWQAAARDPWSAQAAVWQRTAELLRDAPFWRARLGGGSLPPLEAFEITTYDDYAEAVERSFEQTVSELNGEAIRHWVLSSGTSSRVPRRYPWTDSFRAQMNLGFSIPLPMVLGVARLVGKPGPHLPLVTVTDLPVSPAGIALAAGSAIMNKLDESVVPFAALRGAENTRQWLPLYALAADLRTIMATTCDPMFMVLERIEADRELYLSYLRGQRALPDGLPAPRITPERLAHLERVLADEERPMLDSLWPGLRVFHTWRSSVAGLTAQRLARRGKTVHFVDMGYSSTEGPIAQPIDPDAIGGPIHAGSIVHEFLEVDAAPKRENILKPWQLEPGRQYEVLLTTAMGFVRYRLRDIVLCTGKFHEVPTLRFDRRVGGELSVGIPVFSEADAVEVLASVEVDARVRWVFGPGEDSGRLTLYTDGPLAEEHLETMHETLARLHIWYRSFSATGWSGRLTHQRLPTDHPVWRHCEPSTPQAKPRVLIQKPPSTFVTE